MKVALVTPWPNDRSGIADYAFGLAKGLSQLPISLTVYTQASEPQPLEGVTLVTEASGKSWDLGDFDLVVYHFGNNAVFHGHMLDLLERYPGVVHLHDFVLQHLFAGIADTTANWPFYLNALQRLYGESVRERAEKSMQGRHPLWESDDILSLPMSELVLERCQGVIVHSRFVRDEIRQRFPLLPSIVIPQVYPDAACCDPMADHDEFRIGVFGHVQRNRCIDVLLRALERVSTRGREVSVHMVGPQPDDSYNQLLQDLMQPLAGQIRLEMLGYATPDAFHREMAACDLCVALRNPTLGETSAVVTRAIKLGKPIVVTRAGWYAELPECIPKIELGPQGVEQLGDLLQRMLDDESYHRQLGSATRKLAASEYDFERNSRRYLDSLHAFHQIMHSARERDTSGYAVLDPLVTSFHDLQLDTVQDEAALRETLYRKLDFCFEA